MRKGIVAGLAVVLVFLFVSVACAANLVVWSSPDNADALHELAQNFMQKNPDVQIEITPLSWEVLYPRILQDLTSGAGSFDVTTWDLMTAGAIAPGMLDLEAFAKEHPELVDPNFDDEDFIPTAKYVYGYWKDKRIGYPFYGAAMFFFYRKDLFSDPALQAKFKAEYGRDLAVPKTWEEAKEVAKFFTKKFNPDSPTEYGIALMLPRTHTLFYMYLNFFGPYRRSPEGIAKFGKVDLDWGDYFTADGLPAFNSEEGVRALQDVIDLMQYAPDPLGSDYGETLEAFGKGMVAMVPQWTACLASWKESPLLQPFEEKVGVAVMPGGTPVSGGWGLGINAASKNKEVAFRFIQYATSKEGDKIQWLKYRIGPTRKSVVEDPEVLADSPWLKEAYVASLDGASHRPRIPEEPRLEDILVGTLSEVLLGQQPNSIETLNLVASEWKKILGK
ncbi:ABC transporter substrate-binding protein [Candidatus Caldatribacterium saccharofermentans]|uniref:ABC transporter substrate-binding protein n=1 Tax=Candidatus Caldatribacterium saccharofermentans TaxID=1454753 RepID=UPI003D043F61